MIEVEVSDYEFQLRKPSLEDWQAYEADTQDEAADARLFDKIIRGVRRLGPLGPTDFCKPTQEVLAGLSEWLKSQVIQGAARHVSIKIVEDDQGESIYKITISGIDPFQKHIGKLVAHKV